MSFMPVQDPEPGNAAQAEAIAHVIVPRSVDLGDFVVRRALPSQQTRMVGPFVFFDHMGPAVFRSGAGVDVRPHPHIGLATLTYLFDGEIMHRDSLGTAIAIRPGEVNLMTAGRGIVHSERTAAERRVSGGNLHGLQCWLGLPAAQEETDPAFAHHGVEDFPVVRDDDKAVRVVAGSIYGERSPVITASETLFADATLRAGAVLPVDAHYEERAVYVVDGEIDIGSDRFGAGQLLVFRPGDHVTVKAVTNARTDAHVMIVGGAAMDGPRHLWWNFVSSRKERIEQAKAEWAAGHFAKVPGDEIEFIPLPEK
jgi:redox-sensitive bicupin YhaK (pirin superfamily)